MYTGYTKRFPCQTTAGIQIFPETDLIKHAAKGEAGIPLLPKEYFIS